MVYICASCGGEFESRDDMIQHWNEVGIPVPKDMYPQWSCPECSGQFRDNEVVRTTRLGGLLYRPKTPLCPNCYMVTLQSIN